MEINKILNSRYSTKLFDVNKKLGAKEVQDVKDLLRLSASSVNGQPWGFIIAETTEGKNRIAKSTEGAYVFNKEKVETASHVVVFLSRTDMTDEYMNHILEVEDQDGRFAQAEFKEGMHAGRTMFVGMHKYDLKDLQHWMEKQVHLNMGSFLTGLAALGIDSVPMEGFDAKILDDEFNLRAKGFTAVGIVPIGYRSSEDFNADLPKSRLPETEIITMI